jgi:hypothetical protein
MLAGVIFVVRAATNVVIMLEARKPMSGGAATNRLNAVHRIIG